MIERGHFVVKIHGRSYSDEREITKLTDDVRVITMPDGSKVDWDASIYGHSKSWWVEIDVAGNTISPRLTESDFKQIYMSDAPKGQSMWQRVLKKLGAISAA